MATSFIGRTEDLRDIRERLTDGARVVTLVGPGGVGKTTLSRHACDAAPGTAWFCELAEARTLARVCEEVTRASKSGAATSSANPVEALGATLARAGELLVVLDNCEQVPDLRVALSRWLELAPNSVWLATSREPLGLDDEQVLQIAPLSRPPAPSGSARESERRLEEIASSDAVRLFVERAAAARPGYTLAPHDAEAIASIVQRLDGLPLAIELAAARMAILSATDLLQRLEAGLDALATDGQSAPSRQRTMRATVAWSWSLLEPWEASALEQCAVFRGGFTVRAAEAVVDLAAFPGSPPPLDVLQALRRKSLVRAYAPPEAPEHMRLALYETVREYALERSEASTAAARSRHARATIDVASRWLAELDGGTAAQRAAAQLALSLEHDNLLAAHQWALADDGSHPNDGLRAALALTPNLRRRSSPRTELDLVNATLARAAGPEADEGLKGWLLVSRSRLMMMASRFDDANADLSHALSLARSKSDRLLEGRALIGLFSSAEATERFDDAKTFVRAAVAALEGTTSRWLAVARGALAIALGGEPGEALLAFEAAQRLWAEECDSGLEGTANYRPATHAEHALLLMELQRADDAERQLRHAFESARDLGPRPLALLAYYQGAYLHWRGNLEAASSSYRAASDGRDAGALFQPVITGGLAAALAEAGELDLAIRTFDEADAMPAVLPVRVALSVQRGHLDLARARTEEAERETHLARARERLHKAASVARTTSDVRLAMLTLRAALERGNPRETRPPPHALEVAEDASWFRLGTGKRTPIARALLRRLLRELVQARLRSPGRALDVDEVCNAVWPGERILRNAARRRVQVAVSTLRAEGLKEAICTNAVGYLIDPSMPVRVTG